VDVPFVFIKIKSFKLIVYSCLSREAELLFSLALCKDMHRAAEMIVSDSYNLLL